MKTNINIPKLRFKEFTDEWQVKKLGEIFDVRDGTHESPKYFGSGKPLITSKNLMENGTLDLKNVSYISEEDFSSINKRSGVAIGDILFGMIGTIGNPVRIKTSDFAIKNVALIKPKTSKTNYLIHYMNSPIISKQFYQKNAGGTQKFIALGDIRSLEIGISSVEEQEKIADFLTTVDEKIAKLEEKKAGIEKYKKGVMQAIFSQKIRFKKPDGSDFSDWEEKKLGEVGSFKTSGIDKLFYPGQNEAALVNYMNVYRHEELSTDTIINLAKTTVNERQSVEGGLKKGDILFTPSSETPNDIGHSVVIKEDLPNTVFSYHLMRFRPKLILDINFSHYFCNIQSVLKQISQRCQGSTRFTITVGEFSKVKVKIPTSIHEQENIAEFLTKLDMKIELINKELEGAKKFKKALLQQMFV